MNDMMEFPVTFEKFAEEYGFKDTKEVYTNGSDLIPVFRVKQWLEHDNKLRTIETDTAYECGKHAAKWVSASEELPEPNTLVLCYITTGTTETYFLALWNDVQEAWEEGIGGYRLLERDLGYKVIAWRSLPEPYGEADKIMTRAEAIGELKQFSGTTTLKLSANFWNALNIAINALEQETVSRETYESEYLARKQAELELWKIQQNTSEDCISREAVLAMSDFVGEAPTYSNPYAKLKEVVCVEDIESLPSVKPTPR